MIGGNQCPTCSGGGLMPAPGCTYGTNAHTCTPMICTTCNGTGVMRVPARTAERYRRRSLYCAVRPTSDVENR
jgi:hypothetical protein